MIAMEYPRRSQLIEGENWSVRIEGEGINGPIFTLLYPVLTPSLSNQLKKAAVTTNGTLNFSHMLKESHSPSV